MSIKVMSHVWEHSTQKGSALLLLLALADWSNDNGDCWPSVKTLAKKCRMSERNVQLTIRKLEGSGDISVYQNIGIETAAGHTNLYRVNMGGVNSDAPLTVYGVKQTSPHEVKPRSPNTSDDTSVKDYAPNGASADVPVKKEPAKRKPNPAEPWHDALTDAFKVEKGSLTKTADSTYWKAAHELRAVAFPVERVGDLYQWCKSKDWTNFTVMALVKHAPTFLAEDKPKESRIANLVKLTKAEIDAALSTFGVDKYDANGMWIGVTSEADYV